MNRHRLVILFALMASTANAAEVVEHPMYRSWAGSKPGTVVTFRSVTVMNGQTVESTIRYKLAELRPEIAVVERMVTPKGGIESKPQRLEFRRDFPLLPGVKKEEIGKPPGSSEKGEETLQVAGKTYKTQWYVTKGQTEAGESIARTWTTPEFPGMMLKSVLKVPAADKVTTLEVTEIKTP